MSDLEQHLRSFTVSGPPAGLRRQVLEAARAPRVAFPTALAAVTAAILTLTAAINASVGNPSPRPRPARPTPAELEDAYEVRAPLGVEPQPLTDPAPLYRRAHHALFPEE